MKAFVTGGAGFVGGAVVRQLLAYGVQVVAPVRTPAHAGSLAMSGAALVPLDLAATDPGPLIAAMDGADSVFHLAGSYRLGIRPGERPAMWAANVTATGRVLLTNVENDGTIEAGTIAGEVLVEAVKARRLLVGTVTGPVTARDATTERAELTTTAGAIEFAGTVAAGGLYELRTHTGDIRFIPLGGAGFELRAVCFSGRIVPAADLGLAVIRKSTQELVGTVGDGGAVVTLSSFSGGIVIGRR